MPPPLLLAIGLAIAQAAPQFEVASIRPRHDQPDRGITTGVRIEPGRMRLEFASLLDCLALAYRVNRDRIVGPEWLATTRFDIAATLPPGASRSQVPEMLQALLAQRFRLRMHRETRESQGYRLVVRPGDLKLEAAIPGPEADDQPATETLNGSGAGIFVTLPRGAGYALEKDRFEARTMTMGMLADALSLFTGRPVVDGTGVTGYFNIAFDAPDTRILTVRYAASVGVPVPADALQFANNVAGDAIGVSLRRVGLSLESQRLPLEVIVVDALDKAPTEN